MNYDDMHKAISALNQAAYDLAETDLELIMEMSSVTEDNLHGALESIADFLNTLATDKKNAELFQVFMQELEPKAIGQLMLQVPWTTGTPCDPLNGLNKHLAVDVAEALGPDWAQAFYHFAVQVTRIA